MRNDQIVLRKQQSKRILILLILAVLPGWSWAVTTEAQIDSLEQLLATAKDDTNKVKLLNKLCTLYSTNAPDQAEELCEQAKELALDLEDLSGMAASYNRLGEIYRLKSDYKTANEYYEKSLELYRSLRDKAGIAAVLSNQGIVKEFEGDYTTATTLYIDALKLREEIGDSSGISTCYNNIGIVYYQQGDYDKTLEYFEKSLAICQALGDKLRVAQQLNNIGVISKRAGKFDKAIDYYKQSIALAEESGNIGGVAGSLSNIGAIYTEYDSIDKALSYYGSALEKYIQLDEKRGIALCYNNIGNAWLDKRNFDKAVFYFEQSMAIAREIGYKEQVKECYQSLVRTYELKGDNNKALEYYRLFVAVKDSLFDETTAQQVAELEKKYQTEKKEKELAITELKLEEESLRVERRNAIILIIIIGFALLGLISYLMYNRHQLKQRAAFQEAMMEEQSLRSKAVLEAEENERTRIGKDLHDGLGQTLAAVKLNVEALKGVSPQQVEGRQIFENALALIDDSCTEVRHISHDMMPGALGRAGLVAALEEYKDRITTAGVKIHLDVDGMENRLDSTTETIIFRVAQEIVSNALKHAQASNIYIQLVRDGIWLNLMIEDDGVGFEWDRAIEMDGIGLQNIQSRVAFLEGQIDVDSQAGRGTVISINVPLEN